MPKFEKVVLINMGGIKRIADIPIFLFNMFNDKNILPFNQPIRSLAAGLITFFRAKNTYYIYKKAGPSPIFKITLKQAEKIEKLTGIKTEFTFAYSKPILRSSCINSLNIALYNFYSHTTHGIILRKQNNISPPFCIFGEFFDLVEKRIKQTLKKVPPDLRAAVLMSAHSLPEKLLKKRRDPYRHDLEIFSRYIKKRINAPVFLSFQSKLGRIKWLEPSTKDAIKSISKKYDALIIVPLSFVSDNTETVYEIDEVYKEFASLCGIKYFQRIDCFNDNDDFMKLIYEYLRVKIR